jgi:hypothetical protein
MPGKKEEPEFTVTDRRRFSVEDDEVKVQPVAEKEHPAEPSASTAAPAGQASARTQPSPPPEPAAASPEVTAEERAEGQRAYARSTEALDEQLRSEIGAHAVSEEFKVTFERVLEPFYVTAMMQLGLMGQEGPQRRVDIIGARQTIDTLNYLQEKTKGNLTKAEADLLENILYQLRMQYLEITNALAKAVQNPQAGGGPGIPKA